MAMTRGTTPSRIFCGCRVALALAIIVFLSAGIRFTIGPFLKPVSAELGLDRGSFSLVISASLFLYGAFLTGDIFGRFSAAGVLLLIAAVLSVVIDEKARPVCRALALPARFHPVAGGR